MLDSAGEAVEVRDGSLRPDVRDALADIGQQPLRTARREKDAIREGVRKHPAGIAGAIGRGDWNNPGVCHCSCRRSRVAESRGGSYVGGRRTGDAPAAAEDQLRTDSVRITQTRTEVVEVALIRQPLVLAGEQEATAYGWTVGAQGRCGRAVEAAHQVIETVAYRRFVIPTEPEVQ